MTPWRVFFHWPDGGVWGNILASLIWAAPTVAVATWRVRRHLGCLHRAHDELHAKLDRLHESHQELHVKLNQLTGDDRG